MSFKLALLLLFGFMALAVAVPFEDTEEKAEPAEPVAADAEKPDVSLEEAGKYPANSSFTIIYTY